MPGQERQSQAAARGDGAVSDEFSELMDAAIYKEIAAEALYSAAQQNTTDAGARALLRELCDQERQHSAQLKTLKDKGPSGVKWRRGLAPALSLSDHLTGSDSLEGAGLQDTLIYAMKREQQAVQFYAAMTGALGDPAAKRLCEGLAQEELRHKMRLETLYDDTFYKED